MRAGISRHILDKVNSINKCYEPNVPNKATPKPYAVIVQGSDDDNGEVVGFKRNIEIWLYETRTSFKNLDILANDVIKALDMQVIEDIKTNETFTCIFDGAIGQDVVDEEWSAIARGLRFTVIALHGEDQVNTDTWLDAINEYTKCITNHAVYLNTWKKNFEVPSILWRVKDQNRQAENNRLVKESKTLICHIASNNKNEINKILDDIENRLITDVKIPLDFADRRYLTIESITEDRQADMLSDGQLTVKLFRRKMTDYNVPTINSIYGHRR